MTTKTVRTIVDDPTGGQWSWYRRSDGRYQVNSVEVPTYGFAMTEGALRHSCSESMKAVWRSVVLAEHPVCEYFLLCEGESVALVSHPVLDLVPTCQRCVDAFALSTI